MIPIVAEAGGRNAAAPAPGQTAARARLAAVRPHDYALSRNHLDGAVTGLSPYLTHGLLDLPRVLAAVVAREDLPAQHKLVFELGWRAYFRHVWEHRGAGIFESLHPGPLPDAAYAQVVPADIKEARTGESVIDQAVRTLYESGALHNHARMWLASYVVHMRKVHWRAGADWLYAHLLDGDLASNHLSWQWVAGTGSQKPYLFNADNVTRHAPPAWHCVGGALDTSYEQLQTRAQDEGFVLTPAAAQRGVAEPALYAHPPPALALPAPEARALQGRTVWLIHPWSLAPPPRGLPADTVVLGIYLAEFHGRRPWSNARWAFVDACMAELTPLRVHVDAAQLQSLLTGTLDRSWRGRLFEQWVVLECLRKIEYQRSEARLFYWRTNNGAEVDLLVEVHGRLRLAVEIRARPQVSGADLSGLRSFAQAHPDVRRVVVAEVPEAYRLGSVDILPYREFLVRLGRWLG